MGHRAEFAMQCVYIISPNPSLQRKNLRYMFLKYSRVIGTWDA